MHKAALQELAESFGADVTELVVDVDGKTVELEGSAEAQFEQWRALLRQIARTDAALPEDINVTSVPPPPAPAPASEADAVLAMPPEAPPAEPMDIPPLEELGDPGGTVTPLPES
jgi:uncharacterized membrane protein